MEKISLFTSIFRHKITVCALMDLSIPLLQDEVAQHFISWQHKDNLLIYNVKNTALWILTANPTLLTYT